MWRNFPNSCIWNEFLRNHPVFAIAGRQLPLQCLLEEIDIEEDSTGEHEQLTILILSRVRRAIVWEHNVLERSPCVRWCHCFASNYINNKQIWMRRCWVRSHECVKFCRWALHAKVWVEFCFPWHMGPHQSVNILRIELLV